MFARLLNLFKKDYYLLWIIILVVVGGFLRFYRLDAFVTFLGDQARDAIVIKKIITFEHFPAIGAPTSVGQIYLGPFYYYFIAPWLAIFRFEPIGLAFGVAFFSTLYIPVNYFVVKDLVNKDTALISTVFITFSYILIEFSRFSWNPNLLPVFSLLAVYFFIKAVRVDQITPYILAGAFLSFSVQLHYLAVFLIPPIVAYFINKKPNIRNLLFSLFSFIFFSIPLLIFDLRHNLLNIKSFLKLSQSSGNIAGNKLLSIFDSFLSLNRYSFNIEFNSLISAFILLGIIASLILIWRKGQKIKTVLLFFLLPFLGIALYGGPKFPHYLGVIYPLYFIVIAYFLSYFLNNPGGKVLLSVFLVVFVFFNFRGYSFIHAKSSHQIEIARSISKIIYDNVKSDKYAIAAIPEYSDHTYRYFLDVWSRRPTERNSREKTNELFVVCEVKCWPIGDSQWTIAYFAPNKVVNKWTVRNFTIYKLIR